MICIDLCSGLGGFSQAFLDRGHRVIRVDNDPKFKEVPNTIIGDIRKLSDLSLEFRLGPTPDVLLMSPPCNFFSQASKHLHWNKNIPKTWNVVESLRIVFWCIDAVDLLNPDYWILENPRGKLRFILGKPEIETYFGSWGSLLYKPTDLWGRIPPGVHWKRPAGGKINLREFKGSCSGSRDGGRDKRSSRTDQRAKVLYKLSEALCIAIENQDRTRGDERALGCSTRSSSSA